MSFDVCVIGAGIGGLSVALNLQKLMRLVNVTVIADSLGRETNTPVARSLFIPSLCHVKDVDQEIVRGWLADGWNHHLELATTQEASTSGNTLMTGDCVWWHQGDHLVKWNVLDHRTLPREEMDKKEYLYAHGCEFTTVHIEYKLYLQWLLKQFRINGGNVIFDTVFSFQELYGKYDAVVNCVGKRGREMRADEHQHHLTGNMLQTTPIDVNRFFFTQDDIYICPNPHTGLCDVGFLWQRGCPGNEVTEDDGWLIKHRASKIYPAIKNCEVVNMWSEKRAERNPILLEIEYLNCGGPILPIIHNIGHGENTVTFAWGRGLHAARLVLDVKRAVKPYARVWKPFKTV